MKTVLQQCAEDALAQIEQKRYELAFDEQQYPHVLKVGVAFHGKQLAWAYHTSTIKNLKKPEDPSACLIVNKLPIGYENFWEIVQSDMHYVDKSLFIKDLLDRRDKVTLITRPRRFGKTLNLSMLEHFLAANVARRNTQGLFDTLNIAKVPEDYIATHQGQYVVIALSFKDVRCGNFQATYNYIKVLFYEICSLVLIIYNTVND